MSIERNIGDGGVTKCGDWLRPGARRLCGACANSEDRRGCGEILERHEQPLADDYPAIGPR